MLLLLLLLLLLPCGHRVASKPLQGGGARSAQELPQERQLAHAEPIQRQLAGNEPLQVRDCLRAIRRDGAVEFKHRGVS